VRHLISFALVLALPSFADVTVINVTNSVTAYNESSGSFSASSSDSIRLNAQITDGVTNLNFNQGGGHTFAVYLYSLTDSPKWLVYSNANTTAATADLALGQVRFEIEPQETGVYELYAEAIPVNDPAARYPIAWHTLTVTNMPVGGSVIVSNTVIAGNIESGAVQVTVSATGLTATIEADLQRIFWINGDGNIEAADVDRDLVPRSAYGADIGEPDFPWRNGYFSNLIVVGSVLGNFIAVDATKVAKVGETNLVDLTNTEVRVRTPTSGSEAANMDYVLSLGGGFVLWGETNGVLQDGTWLYATNIAGTPVNSANHAPVGPYISTNRAFTLRGPPNGLANTTNSSGTGNALGAGAVDLQTFWVTSTSFDNLAADVASGFQSFIGGGAGHKASGDNSTIGGGLGNVISSAFSTIPGGNANNIAGSSGVIGGGQGNSIAAGANCVIAGGIFNVMDTAGSKDYSGILGGYGNTIKSGGSSGIVGGYDNQLGNTAANRAYHFIGGGQSARVNSSYLTGILIGYGNSFATSTNVVILQGYRNAFIGSTNAVILQGNGITNNARHNIAIVGGDLEVRGRTYIGTLGDYLTANGTNLFYYNSTGGVAQVSTL
jgi:hypothetical protein